jgi:hypothetical protein
MCLNSGPYLMGRLQQTFGTRPTSSARQTIDWDACRETLCVFTITLGSKKSIIPSPVRQRRKFA